MLWLRWEIVSMKQNCEWSAWSMKSDRYQEPGLIIISGESIEMVRFVWNTIYSRIFVDRRIFSNNNLFWRNSVWKKENEKWKINWKHSFTTCAVCAPRNANPIFMHPRYINGHSLCWYFGALVLFIHIYRCTNFIFMDKISYNTSLLWLHRTHTFSRTQIERIQRPNNHTVGNNNNNKLKDIHTFFLFDLLVPLVFARWFWHANQFIHSLTINVCAMCYLSLYAIVTGFWAIFYALYYHTAKTGQRSVWRKNIHKLKTVPPIRKWNERKKRRRKTQNEMKKKNKKKICLITYMNVIKWAKNES